METHYYRQWVRAHLSGVPEKCPFDDPVTRHDPVVRGMKALPRIQALEAVNRWNQTQAPNAETMWRYWL